MRESNAETAEPIGLRMRPSLKKRLDIAAAERGEPLYELVQEAVEQLLAGKSDGPGPTVAVEYRPYLQKLAEVLASGDSKAIEAVTANIDFFRDRMRPDGDARKRR